MRRRSLLYLVLALLGLTLFSGCTDDARPGAGGPSGGEEGADGGDGGDLGPLAGVLPGVTTEPLPPGSLGLIEGHVYDLQGGVPISDATVAATCVRQGLPALPDTIHELKVAPDGSFLIWAEDGFTDCVRITYVVEAPGYTLHVPLESGPVTPNLRQIVYAGMLADG